MGYNIGMRLIEDFLAKSNAVRCGNFRETADMISKVGLFGQAMNRLTEPQVGFKMFLNITPTVTNWTSDNKSFSLLFDENPLADFVELPDDGKAQDELWFSNILCGVLRGALEMVRDQRANGQFAELDRYKWLSKLVSSAMFFVATTPPRFE